MKGEQILQAIWNDVIIAESDETIIVEGNHYFPFGSIKKEYFQKTELTTLCAGDTLTLARKRCELLSELTDVDYSAIWQWGFIERVSTGLVLKEFGQEDESSAYLEVADCCVFD